MPDDMRARLGCPAAPRRRLVVAVTEALRFIATGTALLRSSLRAAILLGLRFVQTRIISVWGLIVVTALCPPSVFTDFAVFSICVSFVSIASLLRLESAFFQSASRDRLGHAFRLATIVGAGVIGVAAAVLAALVALGWIGAAAALSFLVSLGARSIVRLIMAEATAEGDFLTLGNSNLVQAIIQPVVMLLLIGILGPKVIALFMADALGHVLTAGYLLRLRGSAVAALIAPGLWSKESLLAAARRWRQVPMTVLPSSLLAYGFSVVPVLALPYAADRMLAAQVALSMRLLDVPAFMFGVVSVPVLLNRLRSSSGPRRQLWIRIVSLGLIAGSAVLFGLIAVAGLLADNLMTGLQWQGIGRTIAIMAPFYAGIALLPPLQEMGAQLHRPMWQVSINATALIAVVALIVWFGALSAALLGAIGIVSLLRTLALALSIWLDRRPGASVGGASGA